MLPPGIKSEWDENHWWGQTLVIGYEQVREHEDNEILSLKLKASSMGGFK